MKSARAPVYDPNASPMSRGTPIVFVVYGDASMRESLELLIRSAGWRPEAFSSAEEFLSRPRELGPNCLITDVTLPDLSGLDLQQIVADQTPIIFLVNPNALSAVGPGVKNASPAAVFPQAYWNAERLQVTGTLVSQR